MWINRSSEFCFLFSECHLLSCPVGVLRVTQILSCLLFSGHLSLSGFRCCSVTWFCPIPVFAPFQRRIAFRSYRVNTRCVHCLWPVSSPWPLQRTDIESVCTCTHACVTIVLYVPIFISLYLFLHVSQSTLLSFQMCKTCFYFFNSENSAADTFN